MSKKYVPSIRKLNINLHQFGSLVSLTPTGNEQFLKTSNAGWTEERTSIKLENIIGEIGFIHPLNQLLLNENS